MKMSFETHCFFKLMEPILSGFPFVACAFGIIKRNHLVLVLCLLLRVLDFQFICLGPPQSILRICLFFFFFHVV